MDKVKIILSIYPPQVTATDEDSNGFGDIEYSITSGDVMGVFSIDRDNGRLWVIGYIDREMVDMFSFVVTAEDGGVCVCVCVCLSVCLSVCLCLHAVLL